uniref:DNA replication complex GINS protein SLD5 C-terminal domain-containing protein n=1 Tax=Vitis vinifera TaxID=29760 RepID=A5AFG4_VITVI|nr:hypothetical protein VITISV_038867 [Vitis vinifera]
MASGSEEGSGFPADDYESLIATTDVELLKRAWRNEKAAPETLHFQTREQIQLMFNDPFNCEINDFARNLFELLKIWSNKDRKLTALVYETLNIEKLISHLFGHLVPEPRLDTFIFCKSKGSIEAFQLDDSKEVVDLVADDLYILRYNSVNPLIESGQIDLV